MTGGKYKAYNAGLADLAAVARASADALRARLVERPTRFSYAIAALEAIGEAASALRIPPDDPPPAGPLSPQSPSPSSSATEVVHARA